MSKPLRDVFLDTVRPDLHDPASIEAWVSFVVMGVLGVRAGLEPIHRLIEDDSRSSAL